MSTSGVASAATTIKVTTTADEFNTNGKCSLREALRAANTDKKVDSCAAGSGSDTITLPAGTYLSTLSDVNDRDGLAGDYNISSKITINGEGVGKTIIDGNRLDQIFTLADTADLAINNATLTNGYDCCDDMGGMFTVNSGTKLTLKNTVLDKAGSASGGIIWADTNTTLSVSDSTIKNGSAEFGGGLRTFGTTTLTRVVLTSNKAVEGGAIANSGKLTIVDSTIDGNSASGNGAGISLIGENATVIQRSTVSNNVAEGNGGGIVVTRGHRVDLTNVTVSGNSAKQNGGGLYAETSGSFAASAYLNNVTVANNVADSDNNGDGDGGGVFNRDYDTGSRVRVFNTLLGKNTDGSGQAPVCGGSISSYGYNLVSDTKGCTLRGDSTGNILNADPKLGELKNNGGATKTHAISTDSRALDNANPAKPGSGNYACASTDQRGVSRPQDRNGKSGKGRCDIGAFEYTTGTVKAAPSQDDAPAVEQPVLPQAPAVEEPVLADTAS